MRCVWAWRRTGDPDALRDAADVAREGFAALVGADPDIVALTRPPGVRPFQALLAADDGPSVDDLVLAVRGRPDLARAAARALDEADPEAARTFRERAGLTADPR